MTKQWRVRVSGKPSKQPDIALLVQAVLALSEQLAYERAEHEAPSQPSTDSSPEAAS
jgi:hypothetical protein